MLIDYAFIFLLCISITSSYANITIISNPQTKNLKNADLAEVQLQDVEAFQKENKINENGERVLGRKIASTAVKLITEASDNNTSDAQAVKIATEGSGVTKLKLVNGGKADNPKLVKVTTPDGVKGTLNSTKPGVTTTTISNSAVLNKPMNGTATKGSVSSNIISSTQATQNSTKINLVQPTTAVKLNASSTAPSTSTSTTVTTTKSTTTTTTTPKPKKPTITYSVDDKPEIADIVPAHSSNSKFPVESKPISPKLSADEPEQPIAQPSQEFDGGLYRNHRDYIIPIVSIIFAVPILMGMVIVAYRRIRDFWSTRHYRRMDFLVDGMYND